MGAPGPRGPAASTPQLFCPSMRLAVGRSPATGERGLRSDSEASPIRGATAPLTTRGPETRCCRSNRRAAHARGERAATPQRSTHSRPEAILSEFSESAMVTEVVVLRRGGTQAERWAAAGAGRANWLQPLPGGCRAAGCPRFCSGRGPRPAAGPQALHRAASAALSACTRCLMAWASTGHACAAAASAGSASPAPAAAR